MQFLEKCAILQFFEVEVLLLLQEEERLGKFFPHQPKGNMHQTNNISVVGKRIIKKQTLNQSMTARIMSHMSQIVTESGKSDIMMQKLTKK